MPKLQGTASLFGTPDWMKGKNLGDSAVSALNRGNGSQVGGNGGSSQGSSIASLLRKWDTSGIKLNTGPDHTDGNTVF